jgi:hypothetical protein
MIVKQITNKEKQKHYELIYSNRYIADRSHPEVVRRQGKREYFQIAPGG